MLKRGVVLACVVGLALTSAADAATVHGAGFSETHPWGEIDYTAAPGEANVLTFAKQGDYTRLDDSGALISSSDQLTGQAFCLAAVHTALCQGAHALIADLGDGDDSITIPALTFLN